MKIIYLYDLDDWALHNIGKWLAPIVAAAGHEMLLLRADRYYERPLSCDVLYLSFSFLFRSSFPYGRYARELICTIHDPFEVSNFTDRLDWANQPLRPVSPQVFDRVSAISQEMQDVLAANLACRGLYHTPTFPYDAEALKSLPDKRGGVAPIRFFSTTNAPSRYSFKQVAGRLRHLDGYLYDQHRRLSLRQMGSILVRTHRKNIPWLEWLGHMLRHDVRAQTSFRFGPQAPLPRADYLAELQAADVYVCTSFMEGGPLPVMEAVLAGCSILSTPVGQVEAWVRDGGNGYLCRSREEVFARARAYLDDPKLLRAHQAASLAVAAEKAPDHASWMAFLVGA